MSDAECLVDKYSHKEGQVEKNDEIRDVEYMNSNGQSIMINTNHWELLWSNMNETEVNVTLEAGTKGNKFSVNLGRR